MFLQISSCIRISLYAILCSLFLYFSSWAQDNWRDGIGTFRIGMVSRENAEIARARLEPFRLALAERLQVNVEFYLARDFSQLIAAQQSSRIEYGIYSATAYATAYLLCDCIEPLVVARAADGTIAYHSVVLSKKSIKLSLEKLQHVRLAGLAEHSFAGHKFAVFELEKAGITLPEIQFESNGEDAIRALVSNKYDALIGWSSLNGDQSKGYSRGTLKLLSENTKTKPTDYEILWQSTPIFHPVHTVRKSLPGEAKTVLRAFLTGLYTSDPIAYDTIEPMFGGGFVAARHSMYANIVDYIGTQLVQDKAN